MQSQPSRWQPPPRWLAVGPSLGALGVVLVLVDGQPTGVARWWIVALVVASLALVLAILLWPRRQQ